MEKEGYFDWIGNLEPEPLPEYVNSAERNFRNFKEAATKILNGLWKDFYLNEESLLQNLKKGLDNGGRSLEEYEELLENEKRKAWGLLEDVVNRLLIYYKVSGTVDSREFINAILENEIDSFFAEFKN